MFEAADHAGGHASSHLDAAGFTWDKGGHVVFSHFGEFDRLLDEALGDDVHEHERSSFVPPDGRWVPYPFQNNLRYLGPEDAYDCLVGLIEAPGANGRRRFRDLDGAHVRRGNHAPLHAPVQPKVWATPPSVDVRRWIAERVSVVDHRRALRSILLGLDDVGWGPNNTFRFPRSGGTGEIYRRLADRLGARVRYGAKIVGLDTARREIDGSRTGGASTTTRSSRRCRSTSRCPDRRLPIGRYGARRPTLEHNGVWVVGVGCERPLADDRSWLYFADPSVPFYRVTNFAKYAAANVPEATRLATRRT